MFSRYSFLVSPSHSLLFIQHQSWCSFFTPLLLWRSLSRCHSSTSFAHKHSVVILGIRLRFAVGFRQQVASIPPALQTSPISPCPRGLRPRCLRHSDCRARSGFASLGLRPTLHLASPSSLPAGPLSGPTGPVTDSGLRPVHQYKPRSFLPRLVLVLYSAQSGVVHSILDIRSSYLVFHSPHPPSLRAPVSLVSLHVLSGLHSSVLPIHSSFLVRPVHAGFARATHAKHDD